MICRVITRKKPILGLVLAKILTQRCQRCFGQEGIEIFRALALESCFVFSSGFFVSLLFTNGIELAVLVLRPNLLENADWSFLSPVSTPTMHRQYFSMQIKQRYHRDFSSGTNGSRALIKAGMLIVAAVQTRSTLMSPYSCANTLRCPMI